MRTMLWNVTYNRRYKVGKGNTVTCEQWPYKGREASRAVQVAAPGKEEAKEKIKEELGIPDNVELYVRKANNFIIV